VWYKVVLYGKMVKGNQGSAAMDHARVKGKQGLGADGPRQWWRARRLDVDGPWEAIWSYEYSVSIIRRMMEDMELKQMIHFKWWRISHGLEKWKWDSITCWWVSSKEEDGSIMLIEIKHIDENQRKGFICWWTSGTLKKYWWLACYAYEHQERPGMDLRKAKVWNIGHFILPVSVISGEKTGLIR
jgi:hypothetical protein